MVLNGKMARKELLMTFLVRSIIGGDGRGEGGEVIGGDRGMGATQE